MKEGASLPASEVLFASAVFSEDSGFFVAVPAKGAALVNRMQCIREHDRARDRQTERNRALAKSGKCRSFILAGQSGFGNPSGQLGELSVVHARLLYTMSTCFSAPTRAIRASQNLPRQRMAIWLNGKSC